MSPALSRVLTVVAVEDLQNCIYHALFVRLAKQRRRSSECARDVRCRCSDATLLCRWIPSRVICAHFFFLIINSKLFPKEIQRVCAARGGEMLSSV